MAPPCSCWLRTQARRMQVAPASPATLAAHKCAARSMARSAAPLPSRPAGALPWGGLLPGRADDLKLRGTYQSLQHTVCLHARRNACLVHRMPSTLPWHRAPPTTVSPVAPRSTTPAHHHRLAAVEQRVHDMAQACAEAVRGLAARHYALSGELDHMRHVSAATEAKCSRLAAQIAAGPPHLAPPGPALRSTARPPAGRRRHT
jgi:hypothetical protein